MIITVSELLARCRANKKDAKAWRVLWQIVESVCLYSVVQVLEEQDFPLHSVGEVMQDLYLQLQKNGCADLSRFRGTTMPQLRGFLRQIARCFASRWARRERRRRKREAKAIRAYLAALRDGPTERQIGWVYRELQAAMPPRDREKLQCVSPYAAATSAASDHSSPTPPPIPERTRRRWRAELLRKYAG